MASSDNFDVAEHFTDCITDKPLHAILHNRQSYVSTSSPLEVLTPSKARARFLKRVSNGISILMKQHGYCRERASSLILREISQGCTPPSENDLFSAMEKLSLGMDDALKVLAVANAVEKLRKERSLSPANAIEHLSSCLTVIKLLGKIESQRADAHPSSASLEFKGSGLLLNGQQQQTNSAVVKNVANAFKTRPQKSSKSMTSGRSFPATGSLPTKVSRKRSNMDTVVNTRIINSVDKKNCDAVDSKVSTHNGDEPNPITVHKTF